MKSKWQSLKSQGQSGTLDDRYWLDATMELLERADAVLLADKWQGSEGSRAEVVRAEAKGLPVFTSVWDAAEWAGGCRDADS